LGRVRVKVRVRIRVRVRFMVRVVRVRVRVRVKVTEVRKWTTPVFPWVYNSPNNKLKTPLRN